MARVAKKTLPPTRMEKEGLEEEFIETDKSIRAKSPYWAKSAQCFKCFGLLSIIKRKADTQYGETVTLQCQNIHNGSLCLAVYSITESVNNLMRPGDFHPADINWKKVEPEGVPAAIAEAVIRPVEFEQPKEAPESPWQRNTVLSAIWDGFWTSWKVNGHASKEFILKHAVAIKGEKQRDKIKEELDKMPQWLAVRTGFVVNLTNGVFTIIGRTEGGEGPNALPYSDPKYRKKFGFE